MRARFATLPLEISEKKAFTPENSAKFCDTPWKFKGQKPRAMEISHFFLNSPRNSTSFLIDRWSSEFLHALSLIVIPLKIPCP